ncbi:MAG: TonB-dependent receptor [Candidatus Acidiferrales bacterium]
MCRIVLLLLVNLLFVTPLVAQSPNGSISGIVRDPSGATIPGAKIIVVNDATRVQYPGETNTDGIYVVPNLPPGSYRIQVAKFGFKTLIKPDIILHVQDALAISFTLPIGAASETVTVRGGAPLVNTQSGAVSTVIDRQFVENLPLNGRSFNTLLQLTPGVVIAPTSSETPGQFSIAGQRTDANNLSIDGVAANFGIAPTVLIGGSGTGTAQAFSAFGGTSSLVSVDDLQEFRIETSSFAPEFGRSPGGQIILTTRSGTNDFHGGVFDYFRNTVMDANDWFADQSGLPRAAEHHNDFGAFIGGPIRKDRTFFFASYEGARLRLPESQAIQVPSVYARAQASAALAPFLDAFPLPNGQPSSPTAYTARFTGAYSNSASLDAGSIRIDRSLSSKYSIFGRYNNAPSQVVSRCCALNDLGTTTVNTQTLTVGANLGFSDQIVDTLRGNYSTQAAGLDEKQDAFGGATPINEGLLLGTLPAARTLISFFFFDANLYIIGPDTANRTKQLNFVDDLSWSHGAHQLKLGGDYRAIFIDEKPFANELLFSATSVQQFLSTGQAVLDGGTANAAQLLAPALSLYGQDTWKITPRLTLTYGLRWELNPAPSARGTTKLAAWTNVDDPANLVLAPAGTPLWKTTYDNFAPRLGIAYSISKKEDLVVRAGGGIFYDLGAGQAVQLATSFPNFSFGSPATVSLPLTDATPFVPSLSRQPPFPNGVEGYAPDLRLPRSYEWSLALEKSFGRQVISATYLGQAGRDLLRQQALFQPNSNFAGDFLAWRGDGFSNYHALQLQFRKPLSSRVQGILNFTWSHSLDNASNDAVVNLSNAIISAARDYASSDFDVRRSLSGAITFSVPGISRSKLLSLLTSNWSIDSVVVARSGFPFNAAILFGSPDAGGFARSRPDLVPGQPLWIPSSAAPGGRMLNAMAFSIPSTARQGTEGRNDIPGFGLTQIDFSLGRKFPISEKLGLQFRADAFNLFNHPNFANPAAFVQLISTLSSTQMLNQSLGGLNPLFQEGGPRSLQVSLKLLF